MNAAAFTSIAPTFFHNPGLADVFSYVSSTTGTGTTFLSSSSSSSCFSSSSLPSVLSSLPVGSNPVVSITPGTGIGVTNISSLSSSSFLFSSPSNVGNSSGSKPSVSIFAGGIIASIPFSSVFSSSGLTGSKFSVSIFAGGIIGSTGTFSSSLVSVFSSTFSSTFSSSSSSSSFPPFLKISISEVNFSS